MAVESTSPAAPKGAALTEPLKRFDEAWTRVDARLCAAVLLAEAALIVAWVLLKGLSTETEVLRHAAEGSTTDRGGLVVRAILGAAALATGVHVLLRPRDNEAPAWRKKYLVAVTAALVVGLFSSLLWLKTGTGYFSNIINWLNTSSALAMTGGLRGLATFLTLWVALIGGSLATSQGKHINVDVVQRSLGERGRIFVAALVWLGAAGLSVAAAIGFADYIAVTGYKLNPADAPCADDPRRLCDVAPGIKVAHVMRETKRDLFLLGRQVSLDFKTLPRVLGGTKYNDYLSPKEWNAWVDGAAWTEHFEKSDVEAMKLPEDETSPRQPAITIPGRGEGAHGLLSKELNLVLPIGFLMIALRFIIRVVLVLTGHVNTDPDAAHGGDAHPIDNPTVPATLPAAASEAK